MLISDLYLSNDEKRYYGLKLTLISFFNLERYNQELSYRLLREEEVFEFELKTKTNLKNKRKTLLKTNIYQLALINL